MKKYRNALAIAVALLVTAAVSWAQTPGPGAVATQGFTVETLLSQISLYLPEESTQGLGGFGRGVGAGGTARQGGTGQTGASGGQAAGQASTAQGTRAQGFRQLFSFTRDTKLFLTKDQIAKLIPVLQGLRGNPLPTPSKAKQVQASVDGILTVAQKSEYTEYQKQMQKAIDDLRKQFAASGAAGATGGSAAAGQDGNGAFGAQGTTTGQGTQAGQSRQGAAAQMTPTERRQRELDAFIKVLQDRQKQLGA